MIQRYIDNIGVLGGLLMHHGRRADHPITSPLSPVLITDASELEVDIDYRTGYLDIEGRFFACPLEIHFVTLDNLSQRKDRETLNAGARVVSAQIRVHSKDLKSLRELDIRCRSSEGWDGTFMDLNIIINSLNYFVDRGGKLENIDVGKLLSTRSHRTQTRQVLIGQVGRLTINYYENSLYRVGRDDSFWTEAEFSNLPENGHVRAILLDSIGSVLGKFKHTEAEPIVVTFNRSAGYGGTHDRRHTGVAPKDDPLRAKLLVEAVPLFDPVAYRCANLTTVT